MSSLGIICEEPDGKCELCGKIAELRPYGPNKENICYDCNMKHIQDELYRWIERHIFGPDVMRN